MRFLLYANLIAIVVLAGALARLYEGAPLPWLEAKNEQPAPSETVPPLASQPSPPLSVEQILALQLPLPNPDRPAAEAPSPARRSLVLLTEGDYRPFNYRDETGALSGFDIELAAALCLRLDADCHFETRSWEQLIPALKRGEGNAVIASLLIPVPGRQSYPAEESLIFTQSYYSTPGRFAARKDDAPVAATPAALAGKEIAVQAGSVHEAFARSRFASARLRTFATPEDAEKALAEGSVDLLFADRNELLLWTSGLSGACCRLVGSDYADAVFFGEGAGIALRAADVALRDEIDKALSALVADGTYARVSARYFTASIY
ncbi:extracellular solute-binding protein family 3 [Parvibaculum lavamentivorans DS-1]|uniref:Extracellular solute-binding protein family 3 n=1 Tax=Parvibaculum lavamentivorans (strain DS-1 / DSM 13023 / NCIMB 13966) TaxID=402881 RepID=A7HQ65_PARL1|nr:transporter substrate-binding domain-containing protein [Parvibaculum lavamentivorans]ABS62048.1 extracellular solute-binding protein family 3 [Parvibaculum lavamentivorans DS-1]